MQILQIIISSFRRIQIELGRVTAHIKREATGAPSARTSMITPNLYLGGQYRHRGLKTLKKWGITGVVSMRTSVPTKYVIAPWIQVLHLPTLDRHAPSLENLYKGIDFISEQIKAKGKVYVHCRWGEGRGPTMAAAYLISTGLTLEDALNEIRQVRSFANPTKSQRKQLRKIEREYKKRKIVLPARN